MIKKTVAAGLVMVLTFAAVGYARTGKDVKLTGVVVDNMCAGRIAKAPNISEILRNHPKSCLLVEACAASGFSLYSGGNWYRLDDAVSAKVIELLKSSKRERFVTVTVDGTVEGEILRVKSISEDADGK